MTVDKLRRSLKELKPSRDESVTAFIAGIDGKPATQLEVITVIRDVTSKPATIRLWCRELP
jgi:hypothetical protein